MQVWRYFIFIVLPSGGRTRTPCLVIGKVPLEALICSCFTDPTQFWYLFLRCVHRVLVRVCGKVMVESDPSQQFNVVSGKICQNQKRGNLVAEHSILWTPVYTHFDVILLIVWAAIKFFFILYLWLTFWWIESVHTFQIKLVTSSFSRHH